VDRFVQRDPDLLPGMRPHGLLEKVEEVPLRVGRHSPNASPVATFSGANRFVVPCRKLNHGGSAQARIVLLAGEGGDPGGTPW
jgi:hypothetical protein